MKKMILAAACCFNMLFSFSQTVNYSPALTASAFTWFTNDIEHLTVLQMIEYTCDVSLDDPALHISTTPVSVSSFSFAPGFYYTVQLNGTATATGNLTSPPANITFGLTLGPPQSTTNIFQALNPFPNAFAMESYAGSVDPSLPGGFKSVDDLLGTFLSGIITTSTMPNSTSTNFSVTTPQFVSTSTTSTLNIEVAPVLGNQPGLVFETNNCGGSVNPSSVVPTNAVLTITSITLTKTPIQVASINGGTDIFFSSSHTGGGGTITAAPGATVTVQVYANGAPGGNYTAGCNLSGVSFSTGSGSLQVTNGSVTATFIMPASGSVTWNGNFSESSTFGSGGISVH